MAPLTDLRDGSRGVVRRLGVIVDLLDDVGYQQVATLGAVPAGAFKDPAGPG